MLKAVCCLFLIYVTPTKCIWPSLYIRLQICIQTLDAFSSGRLVWNGNETKRGIFEPQTSRHQ